MTTATEKLPSSPAQRSAKLHVDPFPRAWTVALIAVDVLAFWFSAWLAAVLVGFFAHERLDAARIAFSASAYIALWLWMFGRLGLYERSFAFTIQDEIYATVAAMALGIVPQLILFTVVPSIDSSRLVLVISLAISIVSVTALRAVAHRARDIDLLLRERRVALVGEPARLRATREELFDLPGTHVLSIPVDEFDLTMAQLDTSSGAAFESMPWFIKALRFECDTVIFTDVPDPRHIPGLLAAGKKWGLQVAFATPRIRSHAYRLGVEILGHQALIVPRPVRAASSAMRFVKRAFDVVLASLATLAVLPIVAGCGLILACGNKPVLQRDWRIGRDGKPFQLLRFATPVFGLRELPALLNVLRGEMSMVGPRPHDSRSAEALRAYNPRYAERLMVAPGLTGWALVHGAAECDEHELGYDLFYVENWGLFLDCYIVLKATAGLAARIWSASRASA